MFALGLPLKITFAGVGYEERSNGSVAIVGAEISMASIEPAELAAGPPRFEDRSAGRGVSQLLRQPQILRFADRAEFVPVLLEMFVEFFLAAKAGARGVEQQPKEKKAGDSGYAAGHQTIRSFAAAISPLLFRRCYFD
jgi:hypothetical protein